MLFNPIQGQGQGHGGLKVEKMAEFKVYRLRQHACNQTIDSKL